MKRIRNAALAGAFALLSACSAGFRAGPVGLANGAAGELGDTHSSGLTIGAHGEFGLVLAAVTGEIAWTRFSSRDANGFEVDDMEFWEFTTGARFFTGPIIIGGQLGYLTNDHVSGDEIIRPEIGLRLGKLDLLARYKLGGDTRWWSLGASYSFW